MTMNYFVPIRPVLINRYSLKSAFIISFIVAVGCNPIGGLNSNQRAPGSGDDGVELSWGEIAVDSQGNYFLSSIDESVVLVDLETGTERSVLNGFNPSRMAFANQAEFIYLIGVKSRDLMVIAYDIKTDKILWQKDLDKGNSIAQLSKYERMMVTEDDTQLVIADRWGIEARSTIDGAVTFRKEFERTIEDIDIISDARLIVTLDTAWESGQPTTAIYSIELHSGKQVRIEVPNCSDELIVTLDEAYAFLAPTTCVEPASNRNKDPISVIDLEEGRFVRNLPGFGPVALDKKGHRMVAFMDMDNLDESLFDDPQDVPERDGFRYHLMFIDLPNLSFDTFPLSDVLPRYALTPDGNVLLIDEKALLQQMRMRILDIDSRSLHSVTGPDVKLDNFVITSDSRLAYLIDRGLYELSISDARVHSIDLDFTPENINITPDDHYLILRESDTTLWLYDLEERRVDYGVQIESKSAVIIDVDVAVDTDISIQL